MPRRRWGVRAGGAKTTFLVRGAQPADNSKGAFEQYPDADQLLTVLTPPPAPVTVAGPANAGQASPAAPEGKSKAGKSKVVALWSRQARGHFKSAVTELRHPFLLTPHEMVFVKHPDQKSTWKRELLSIAHPALARKHPANYDGWKVLIFRPVLGLGSLRDLIHGVGYPLEPFALKYGQQVREHHNVSSARSHLAAQCRWQRCNGNGAMATVQWYRRTQGPRWPSGGSGSMAGRSVPTPPHTSAPAHKCASRISNRIVASSRIGRPRRPRGGRQVLEGMAALRDVGLGAGAIGVHAGNVLLVRPSHQLHPFADTVRWLAAAEH